MKSKLRLKKEVITRLSAQNEIKGGTFADTNVECAETPYYTRNPNCKATFFSQCTCVSMENCDPISLECPSEPVSNGCGDASNHCTYTCQTDKCVQSVDICIATR